MVAAVMESPSRSPSGRRHRLANSTTGDFELRHWRPAKKSGSSGMKGRWVPPEIEIPGGEGDERGYTSLRDIMSSPEYAAAKQAHSPADGGSAGRGDVHMIRHPLVKHAAYAYLQLTPSAREDPSRHRRGKRGPLCRLILSCIDFVGAFFAPA